MGSSEIWDKYHKCMLQKQSRVKFLFLMQQEWYIPNFTAIRLFSVHSRAATDSQWLMLPTNLLI